MITLSIESVKRVNALQIRNLKIDPLLANRVGTFSYFSSKPEEIGKGRIKTDKKENVKRFFNPPLGTKEKN